MFATLEEKLIVGAIVSLGIMVGILGYNHHERSEGAAICVSQQTNASTAEIKKDASDVTHVLADYSTDLAAIPIAASHTPSMLMCDAPSVVRQNSTTRKAKPANSPAVLDGGGGMQAGNIPRVDIGPAVQDITYASLLCSADATELWELAVKESHP